MATKMVRQTMFTTGEVDETVYKRTELDEYLTAAKSLLNVEVGTTGLGRKRKGSKGLIDATTYCQSNSNTYEFVDANGVYYAVIMSNLTANVFTIDGDTLTFLQTVVVPYGTADLDAIDYTQDNDSIIFTHQSYAPARLYISSYGAPTFAFQYLTIYPYPAYDFGLIDYNNFTVALSVLGNVLTFEFTGLLSDPGFTTAWIGGQIVGGGDSPEEPLGYAIITNVVPYNGGTGKVIFTAQIRVAFETSGYDTIGSEYSVKQPAWSASLGYPAKVLYYQNRVWFANTPKLPVTLFGSQINKPVNFDVGVGRDTDAIVYTIGQSNTGGIQWMNGGKQFEVYCQNNEFVCPQDVNTALTPSTFSIRQQSSYGASSCKPINYLNDSYFIAKTGKAIINFKFDGVGLSYTATNISAASSHLVKNPRNRAILQGSNNSQDNFIYYVNNDNTLTSFQFAQQHEFAALTPLQFQLDEDDEPIIDIIDVATINNELYLLKYYTLSNKYILEKFVEEIEGTDYIKIDSYINSTMNTAGVVAGLSVFNGYTVQVVFENQDYGEYLVSGGSITVDNPNEDSGSVQIGLLYPFEIIPMYIYAFAQGSNYMKKITRIFVDYVNSLDWYINGKLVNYQIFADIQEGLPLTPQSGTEIKGVTDGWNRTETLTISQNSPFDCQITGIGYQVNAKII